MAVELETVNRRVAKIFATIEQAQTLDIAEALQIVREYFEANPTCIFEASIVLRHLSQSLDEKVETKRALLGDKVADFYAALALALPKMKLGD